MSLYLCILFLSVCLVFFVFFTYNLPYFLSLMILDDEKKEEQKNRRSEKKKINYKLKSFA